MKKIILFLFILFPLISSAKYFKANLIYKNETVSEVQVRLPFSARQKYLWIKESEDGKKKKVLAEDIFIMELFFDDVERPYIFRRGYVTVFKRNKDFRKTKREIWSLITNLSTEKLLVSTTSDQYGFGKEKGKEILVGVHSMNFGYYLSKLDDDMLVSIDVGGIRWKTLLERSTDYLFPDCPNFMEEIDKRKIGRDKHMEAIAEIYSNCSK